MPQVATNATQQKEKKIKQGQIGYTFALRQNDQAQDLQTELLSSLTMFRPLSQYLLKPGGFSHNCCSL